MIVMKMDNLMQCRFHVHTVFIIHQVRKIKINVGYTIPSEEQCTVSTVDASELLVEINYVYVNRHAETVPPEESTILFEDQFKIM
jgi:hypothetical protein